MKQILKKTFKNIFNSFPLILGMMLLVSLISSIIPKSFYLNFFKHNIFINSFLGSLFGSISIGNPAISYILGGEFLSKGISLIAVTAFIISWVTVGVVQIPMESMYLGKKFTISRNLSAFILSIVSAFIVYILFNII